MKERLQWIGAVRYPGYMRGDGRQYVVARKEHASFRIVQAEVIFGMPWRVLHKHLSPGQM